MSTTPRSVIPPPVDDPERRAARTASFEETLDDTIDQSFPASDPPSSNPAPSYSDAGGSTAAGLGDSGEPRVHIRHEGLVWAAGGALGAIAALAIVRYVYGQREPRRVA